MIILFKLAFWRELSHVIHFTTQNLKHILTTLDIELGPDVYDSTAFKIKIVFENSTFKADQDVFISCYLALDSSSQTEAYEIPISRYIP